MKTSKQKTGVAGLTLEDYRCPICDCSAIMLLPKKPWVVCSIHGAIEGVLKIATPNE